MDFAYRATRLTYLMSVCGGSDQPHLAISCHTMWRYSLGLGAQIACGLFLLDGSPTRRFGNANVRCSIGSPDNTRVAFISR